MNTVTETITPEKATQYLSTSKGNRPINNVYVRSYADTMRRGAWMLNGVPIIFDAEGHLLDGHHRLHAVVAAGIPVKFDVVRGAPEEAFTTYDVGRHRTLGQLIAMQNIKHYNMIGSIVNANETLMANGRIHANNARMSGVKRTLSDSYETFNRDRTGYMEVASYICRLQDSIRIIPASWAGGLYYYLTHTGGYEPDEVKPFFDCLFDLNATEPFQACLLRNAIVKQGVGSDKRKKKPLEVETLWAYIVKAWNAYVKGSEIKILKYDESREDLPKLILR
jgi:hypothetical protein